MLPRLIGTARSRSGRASFQSSGSPFALLAAAHKELEMRRRDFAISLALTAAMQSVRAQQRAKPRRVAIVVPAGPIAHMSEILPLYQSFFEELRRLGDIEGKTSPLSGIPARAAPNALPLSLARSSTGTRTRLLPFPTSSRPRFARPPA
jgi:hypothetical protein